MVEGCERAGIQLFGGEAARFQERQHLVAVARQGLLHAAEVVVEQVRAASAVILDGVHVDRQPFPRCPLTGLRADAHAQYEIRVYADIIRDICRRWVPLTYEAFMSYRVGGAHFSEKALAVVRRMLDGEKVEQAESGLSAREWRELMETLDR